MTSTRCCGDDFNTLKMCLVGVFTGCELFQSKTVIVIEKINFQIFVYEKSTQDEKTWKFDAISNRREGSKISQIFTLSCCCFLNRTKNKKPTEKMPESLSRLFGSLRIQFSNIHSHHRTFNGNDQRARAQYESEKKRKQKTASSESISLKE